MKLSRLRIENYGRLIDLEIDVREHLILVGANDVGKSSLLRALDLVLGASTAQLYASISKDDFRDPAQPLLVEVDLTDFSDDDRGRFPDEITVDPTTTASLLTIRLSAFIDELETLSVVRTAPSGGTGRQLSRDQLAGLGWKFLSSTAQSRDLRDGRRSAMDEILSAVDLGIEKGGFEALTEALKTQLEQSPTLTGLRGSLAEQLSKALPEAVEADNLSFVPGSSADEDALSDVRLQILKGGVSHDLVEQSDGTRALFAIALYDLMSAGANVVGIDEPEVHLHPTSQRNLARLLRSNLNQKIIATHSSDIVGAFSPDSIVVVRKGGEVVQPKAAFLSDDERMSVRWWVRDRLEPLTSHRVVAVEGLSDRILLDRVAELTDRNLDRLGVSLVETGGSGEMAAVRKLFGDDGFRVPLSRLIDEDAEDDVADELGVNVGDLAKHSVWVCRKDLEDEYVRALGPAEVWGALSTKGYFKKGELASCIPSGPGSTYTHDDVADFCRRKKSGYKVNAALSILHLLTPENARQIPGIEKLLVEISGS